jgi:hypothetical protein
VLTKNKTALQNSKTVLRFKNVYGYFFHIIIVYSLSNIKLNLLPKTIVD